MLIFFFLTNNTTSSEQINAFFTPPITKIKNNNKTKERVIKSPSICFKYLFHEFQYIKEPEIKFLYLI